MLIFCKQMLTSAKLRGPRYILLDMCVYLHTKCQVSSIILPPTTSKWTPKKLTQITVKVEAAFPYSGNVFFKKSIIHLVEMDFLFSENSVFDQSYFSASGNHYLNRGKQFSKQELIFASGQPIFLLVKTIFFFSIFQSLLTVIFRLDEKYFSTKSFISASGNRF